MNIYEFAQKTELRGIKFYQNMAEASQEIGVKNIFRTMASDEEKMLAKLAGFSKHYPEIHDVDSSALRESSIVFDSICNGGRCNRIGSDLDAYQLAVEAEKKIVDQYLAAAVPEKNQKTKRMLLWLAAFETHKLREIEQLFDFVNAPNNSLEWGEFSNLDEFHNFGYYEDLRRGELES